MKSYPKRYQLNSEIQLIDLALFFPKKKILIISDLHLGMKKPSIEKGC